MVSTALSRRLRLAAPVLAVGVVAAGVTVPRLADAADASAALPPRTAAQLLEDVSQADVDGLSGTVVATSRLGLPELPSDGHGGSALSLTGLLSGSTTASVWKAGDDRSRVAVRAPWAQFDVVRDGGDVWTYDSATSDVTHLVLPEHAEQPATSGTATPQDLAERLLSFVEPTTTVSVGRAEEVAGRAAYELVLEPAPEQGTLVQEVRIAVDGETSVPLRVQAFGTGAQKLPAVEVTFTDVDFSVPDSSVFGFTPPAGSTVTERSLDDLGSEKAPQAAGPQTSAPTALPQVLGSGWSTVVETSGVRLPEDDQGMLGQLSSPVEGGRTISSALLSVLLTDDGRMLVGSVPPARLVELAGR